MIEASMRPYGRSAAYQTSLGLSMPHFDMSTRKWCLFGIDRRISAISGCASSTASPMA